MPAAEVAPSSAVELCAAVRDGKRITISRLDRILHIEESAGTVEVQAGVTWRSLAAALRPDDKRATNVRTTMPSVGESLAWNAGGPDGRPAVAHVEAFALVTPDGVLCRISRQTRAELFALAVGGRNLFGVPYSVTLRLSSLERAIQEARTPETVTVEAGMPQAKPLVLLIPPERVEALVAFASAQCESWRVALHAIGCRRILAEDETLLRWARRDYIELTLHLGEPATMGGAVRGMQLRQCLIEAAIRRGGSFPIHRTPEATREQTLICYPEIRKFVAEKRRLDRHERLVNDWYLRLRRLLERGTCEVRWGRYAA